MGVEMEEVSQTERYSAGPTATPILTAVAGATRSRRCWPATAPRRRARARERAGGRRAGRLGRHRRRRAGRAPATSPGSPTSPTAATAAATRVTLTAYDDDTTDLVLHLPTFSATPASPTCRREFEGKLVWKVDWPMRWAFEHVDFEPAAIDHATPGLVVHRRARSSWRTSSACRGRRGSATPSSASPASRRCRRRAAACPTAEDALRILEAPILRWLYVRREPTQTFNIDFGPEVVRLYDEWDALGRKAADPARRDAQVLAFERAVGHLGRDAAHARRSSYRSGCCPRSPT